MKRKVISILLAVVLLISFTPTTESYAKINADSNLPVGAKEYKGNYYYAFDEVTTWENAESKCESMGGHLAVVTNSDEQLFLKNTFRAYKAYWIGAKYINNTWEWITGEKWDYTNWSKDFPKAISDSNYLVFNGRDSQLWRNEVNDYDRIAGYICEWEGSSDKSFILPVKVTKLDVNKSSATSANISWKEISDAEGYSIYMKTEKNGNYTKIADIDAGDVTTYNKTKLISGNTYYFIVRAYKTILDEKSYGELSATKKITLK